MNRITLDDLRRILAGCAGADVDADLGGDILDTPLEELGYDSLAILETAVVIELDHGVKIPDERIAELSTPRAVLDEVNSAVAAAG